MQNPIELLHKLTRNFIKSLFDDNFITEDEYLKCSSVTQEDVENSTESKKTTGGNVTINLFNILHDVLSSYLSVDKVEDILSKISDNAMQEMAERGLDSEALSAENVVSLDTYVDAALTDLESQDEGDNMKAIMILMTTIQDEDINLHKGEAERIAELFFAERPNELNEIILRTIKVLGTDTLDSYNSTVKELLDQYDDLIWPVYVAGEKSGELESVKNYYQNSKSEEIKLQKDQLSRTNLKSRIIERIKKKNVPTKDMIAYSILGSVADNPELYEKYLDIIVREEGRTIPFFEDLDALILFAKNTSTTLLEAYSDELYQAFTSNVPLQKSDKIFEVTWDESIKRAAAILDFAFTSRHKRDRETQVLFAEYALVLHTLDLIMDENSDVALILATVTYIVDSSPASLAQLVNFHTNLKPLTH